MSGHSKWAGIKHHKMAQDAKRGRMFTKVIREIMVSARQGGGNPENNPRLRKAMDDARTINMPMDNVTRAVQRGTGELPGMVIEEIVYEGYGPGGVAVMLEATSDNRNRTTSEIRKIFANHGGNLGENGCVAWMFHKKGYITVDKKEVNEEVLMSLALDSGAEDMHTDDDEVFEIITLPEDYEKVQTGLKEKKVPFTSAEITYIPQTYVKLEDKKAESMLTLMDELEEQEDVNNVYANFDIPKEIMEKINTTV